MKNQYSALVKIGNNPDGTAKMLKYRTVNDLLKFCKFLDINFNSWRFINVYKKGETNVKKPLASFTKSKRPTSKHI